MDIFTKKAKVRSQEKTYDKNNMPCTNQRILARSSREGECGYGYDYDCARSYELEREFSFFVNLSYIMSDSSYNSRGLNFDPMWDGLAAGPASTSGTRWGSV